MALGRIVEAIIGQGATGTLVSGLDIEFRIERSITFADNNAELTIYNAKVQTRNLILVRGNSLVFKIGYEDEAIATIFVGQITEAKTFKEGSDWVTVIKAISGKRLALNIFKIPVTLTYTANTPMSAPISAVAALMGLVVNGIQNANVPMTNGFAFAGTTRETLRVLSDMLYWHEVDLYIDNNELVIYRKGLPSKFGVVLLSFAGGLLSINDITDEKDTRQRIGFESLIIPQLQMNAPITFQTPDFSGTFITEKLLYDGNNFGGDFRVTGEASA